MALGNVVLDTFAISSARTSWARELAFVSQGDVIVQLIDKFLRTFRFGDWFHLQLLPGTSNQHQNDSRQEYRDKIGFFSQYSIHLLLSSLSSNLSSLIKIQYFLPGSRKSGL
jgi:hypothetical protein